MNKYTDKITHYNCDLIQNMECLLKKERKGGKKALKVARGGRVYQFW